MKLSIGIVGLPNVGKSTLFNALTLNSVPAENYPFCTIDPSVGVVAVPDKRLHELTTLSHSAKTIPAIVEFVDIAGLVKGASEGEGLGNKFLSHIREVDAILEVVRIFEDDNIIHVHNAVDPLSDIETIHYELCMADLETVNKRLATLGREVKRGDEKAVEEAAVLEKVKKTLESGALANSLALTDEEALILKSMQLLTNKPVLYCLNKKTGAKNLDEMKGADGAHDERFARLLQYFANKKAQYVLVDAGLEHEIKDMTPEEKVSFRDSGSGSGIDTLITKSYELLNLITYFTTGEDETRAWTIQKGWSAPMAGTAIHTDFKDKFIRAEVIASDDLISTGSYATARSKGLVRTEGKEYIVKDGDVVEFRI